MAAMVSTIVWFLGFCSILFSHGEVEASHHIFRHLQSSTTTTQSNSIKQQPYRTGFHFQPSKNWMNDPNGPMIYKGIYHLFYQWNPLGAVWGNIVWAHATSTDLVNWIHHEHAIYPSEPFDINGCWSGSATILPGGKPAILYTGIDPENRQVQNLALPKNLSDPYLKEWVKPVAHNPLMTPINNGINASSFRDPTTAWKGTDGKWRVIIGSKIDNKGLAILYRSKDFIHWIKAKRPLHSDKTTGMWECPDFFPVPVHGKNGVDTSVVIGSSVKYVLKNSLDNTKHDYYTIGSYNHVKDKYVPDEGSIEGDSGLRYDYGKFYASKTFFDSAKNRRVLWGWINESSSVEDDVKKGWSGVQAIPRKLWLDNTGKQLVQWPIEEIEKLRTNHVSLPSQKLKKGSLLKIPVTTPSQADVEVTFELPKLEEAEKFDSSWVNPQILCSQKEASVKGKVGPFGLLVLASNKLEEQTAIFFRVYNDHNKYKVVMCSDQSRSSLEEGIDKTTYGAFVDVDPHQKKLSLRSLVDRSIVESFGDDGKTCMTARVYPKLAIGKSANLYVFNHGSEKVSIKSLKAWSMKKAQIKY